MNRNNILKFLAFVSMMIFAGLFVVRKFFGLNLPFGAGVNFIFLMIAGLLLLMQTDEKT